MEARALVLGAMLAYAAAGPMRQIPENSDSCAVTCKPSSKFHYLPGHTYTYDYKVQTVTSMDGASEEQAALSISGEADIDVIEQCELSLTLKNMKVHETNPSPGNTGIILSPKSDELRQLLHRTPLRFAFQDGVIAELCPDSKDNPWALNVKRGLLSALQVSMQSLKGSETVEETDVNGKCETKYKVNSQRFWASTSITRSKNLRTCTNRHGFSGSLRTMHYQTDAKMQSAPLMESEHECQQVVSRQGVISSSTCTERHLFRPFSSQRSGAVTNVIQTLTLLSSKSGISSKKDPIHDRAEMTFDHGYGMKDSSEARTRAEGLLSTLCESTLRGIGPDVPRIFSYLVGAVSRMDYSDLRDVYQQLQRRQICPNNNDQTRKFFLDAMPMANSNGAVEMMKELLVGGDVSGIEADLWLAALAFIPHPTSRMMTAVQVLLKIEGLKQKAMLPVSSMVHNYCQGTDCSDSAIHSIMDSLEEVIGYRCPVTEGNINNVLIALAAIGNTGQSRAASVLSRCLDDSVPTEVRVTAAQAYRRMPCNVNRRPLMAILKDTTQQTEVRITAFLQMMTCPSSRLLDELQVVMENEAENSQIGSFMYSHLSNLMETSSPLKQEIKKMLKDLELKKSFSLNPFKFSRNYEKSAFLHRLKSGFQAESNVIFSAESPVPRSITANLTVDVFGHSINLLEVGGRLEGMEHLFDAIQSDFLGKDNSRSTKTNLYDLKGSGYARIFGNQLLFKRFQGIKSFFSGQTFNLLDFLIKLSKSHDYLFTQSVQFLDSTMTIPTVAGLPLTLSVNGTAVVDVKAAGKIDLRKMSASPRSLMIEEEIRPSGAVNVDGVMSIDALLTQSGIKVASTLHSRMAVRGRVELDRGRVLNVQVDMPDDKIDVLDVRTQFFILYSGAESEQMMITENRKEFKLCTGDLVSKVTGLEICGQLQFPNASMKSEGPYFPLTGPSSVSLVLHKRDSHTGYKLLAKRVENKRSSIAQLSFDTPGSSVVRAVSFDMMIDYPQKEAEISFASPWKKTSMKGSAVNEDGMKSLTGSLVIDDDQIYSTTAEIKVEQPSRKLTVLTPMLEIRRPGADRITLMGNVQIDSRWRQFSHDLTLNGVTKKPLQFQGTFTNTQQEKSVSSTFKYGNSTYSAQAGVRYNLRLNKNVLAQFHPTILLSTPKGEVFRLEGSTDFRQKTKSLRSEHTLTIPGVLKIPINFKCNIVKKSQRKERYNVDVRLKSRPFTGSVNGFVVLANSASANLRVDYNVIRKSRDRITLNSKLINKSTAAFRKYTVVSSVEFRRNPDWNVATNLDFEHKKRHTGGSLELKMGKDLKDKSKHILLSASVDRKIKSWSSMNVTYKIRTVVPALDVNYAMSGQHAHTPKTLNSRVNMKYNKGNNLKAAINLQNKSDRQLRLTGDASLVFPAATINKLIILPLMPNHGISVHVLFSCHPSHRHLPTRIQKGHSYMLDSSVNKQGKQYVHSINMKTHNGPLLTMASTYKLYRNNHLVTSDIDMDGFKPIKMSSTVALHWDNLKLQGEVLHGKNRYSINTLSKLSNGPRGKWILELSHPSRHVAFVANGGLLKNSADMELDLAWDKERDNSAKITASVSGSYKNTNAVKRSVAKLDITTPFQPLKKVSASLSFNDDQKRYGVDGKFTLGSKSNAYYSTLDIRKPLSASNAQMSGTFGSPIRGWKRLQASVDHQVDSSSVNTVLKASKGKNQMRLSFVGVDKSIRGNSYLTGDISINSNITGLENVLVTLSHENDGSDYKTSGSLKRNKDRYSVQLDVAHQRHEWQVQHKGQLKIVSPSEDIITAWQHENSADNLQTSFTSTWGHAKELKVKISGNKHFTQQEKNADGVIYIQSPWKTVRDISLSLNQNMSTSHFIHKSSFIHNSHKIFSADLKYQQREGDINGEFSLTTALSTKKQSGSMTAKYGSYPATSHIELHLGPRHSYTGDVSFSKTGPQDMEGSLRLTTPVRTLRTITISGSSQKQNEDLIMKGNLDYGLNYDAEVRIRPDSLTLGRVRIHTPFSQFSALNVGYHITGSLNDFDATADFTVQPTVDEYSALLNWKLNSEIASKLRINMPIRDLQYVQVIVNSNLKNQGRSSNLEVEYYPRQIYSVNNFYSTSMPVVFALDVQTPIKEFEEFGLSLKHQHDDSSISLKSEVQYQQTKIIDSTLNLNWERNLQSNLIVKTAFPEFEESHIILTHDGNINDFDTNLKVAFMHEHLSARLSFKYGYATSATFTLTSSLPHVKTVDIVVKKRGHHDNIRGSALIGYGDSVVLKGTLAHRFTSDLLKTKIGITSSFIKDIKSTVELSNRQGIMQADMTGQYGNNRVQSTNSLQIDQADFNASASIKYKLAGGPNEVLTATFNKKGGKSPLEMVATFSSPFTEDIKLALLHNNDLPSSLKSSLSVNYGQLYAITSENTFSNGSNKISVSTVNTAIVSGVLKEVSGSFSQTGDIRNMIVHTFAKYQNKKVDLNLQWNTLNGINTDLVVTTPILYYERIGVGLTHIPTDNGFRQESRFYHLDKNALRFIINFWKDGQSEMYLNASVIVPDLSESGHLIHLIVYHDFTNPERFKGSVDCKFFVSNCALTYAGTGDLAQMAFNLSMDFFIADHSISMEGNGSLIDNNAEISGKASVSEFNSDDIAMISLNITGSIDGITLELEGGKNSKRITVVGTFQNVSGNVSGKLSINTPFLGFENVGGFFKHSGDLNRFNSEGTITYQDGKDISGKVSFYRYKLKRLEATVELGTPFDGFQVTKAEYRHSGSADSFFCYAFLQFGDGQKISTDLRATLFPKYDITLTVKTPFSAYENVLAEAKLESVANAHTASSSLDLGYGQRYGITGSLDTGSTPMTLTGKLTTPHAKLSNVEIKCYHQGPLNDFITSFTFDSPETDIIKGDAIMKYTEGTFDINTAISLSSEIEGMQDLRIELKNQDDDSKMNGHLMARWAPQQQISLDGTYMLQDNWSKKELQTDLTLVTPIEYVRMANLHVQHEQNGQTYSPKIELTLNGQSVVDVESELSFDSNPSVSFISRKPWPTQMTCSLKRDGEQVATEFFVNWNRDESGKNVRVQTKARNIQTGSDMDMDYSVKVIHPSRTMSSGISLEKLPNKLSSGGFLAWDDRADKKIFYNLVLNDVSSYHRKMHKGTVKLGIPDRVMEGSGFYSNALQATAIDGSFSWDAERDTSKQVSFNTKLTQGETTKMDITLRLPAINKEVHIDHEMKMNKGRTVWDGRTQLSYSPDSRKTLTLDSSIKDMSDFHQSGKNYTLALSITHPHTDTDISFTSHIGSTRDRFSAAMDTVYLTSNRQRKNIALWAEIDRLRRVIDLEWISPMKKVSVRGHVEPSQPYIIKLTNTYDDEGVIQSLLNFDPERSSIVLSTNYDLNYPEQTLVLKAEYVNASAVMAELYRQQNGIKYLSDGLLTLRLNTSTLLHTRLNWRPDIFSDVENYFQMLKEDYLERLVTSLETVIEATGEELQAKYAAITEELYTELSPVLNLLESEFSRLGQQMDRFRKVLKRMYRNNDFYLQDMGMYVQDFIDALKDYSNAYRITYSNFLAKARQQLDMMANYNIREKYHKLVESLSQQFIDTLLEQMECINGLLAGVAEQLMALKAGSQEKWEALQNHPTIQKAKERVRLLGQDYEGLMAHLHDRIRHISIPEQYTSAIYNAHDTISSSLSGVLEHPKIRETMGMANEIYQQGAWAYRYWNIENNSRKQLQRIVNLIEELVKEELKQMTDKVNFLNKINVTVYDPENGEIQMEVALPIALKSLKELPDLEDYLKELSKLHDYLIQADDLIDQYLLSPSEILDYFIVNLALRQADARAMSLSSPVV